MIDLIYCAGGNPRLSYIASEEGWLLGFRSDKRLGIDTFPARFIDVDYKQPDFAHHLAVVARYRPKYATVPDLSESEICSKDVARALEQAEQLAQHCEIVLLVPKLSGHIEMLPAHFAIGYSVPSQYGGASYPLWELAGRRVHLLGGSPKKQLQVFLHLSAIAQVISADGNYAQKMAVQYGEYWTGKRWIEHPRVKTGDKDLYLECWRWSCQNIHKGWRQLCP